jgi:hypothetical protein
MDFITKDSGEREEYGTGMVRDTQRGKPRYDLIWAPILTRWAHLMARGADKYGENNWMNACTVQEYNRFRASAWRHFMQAMNGEQDEDHIAAIMFNLSAMEYTRERLENDK